jgi:WD40 repeat protein
MAYSKLLQRVQTRDPEGRVILANRQGAWPRRRWIWGAIISSLLLAGVPVQVAFSQSREAGRQKKEVAQLSRPQVDSLRLVKRIQLPGEAKLAILRGQGKYLAVWLKDQTIQIWDVNRGRRVGQLAAPKDMSGISLTDDGQRLVMLHSTSRLGYRNTVTVWDVVNGRKVTVLKGRQSLDDALHPQGRMAIAWGRPEGVLQVVDTANGKEISRLPLRQMYRYHRPRLTFGPNGKYLALGLHDTSPLRQNLVVVWDVDSGRQTALLDHTTSRKKGQKYLPPDEILIMDFSPDGRLLATGTTSMVCLWEVATGRELARLAIPGGCKSLLFCPDSRLLATAVGRIVYSFPEIPGIIKSERTVKVWDTATGKEVASLMHDNPVSWVYFSPVGRLLATLSGGFPKFSPRGSSDSLLSLWQVDTGKKVASLVDPSIYAVNFQADGKHLVTWSKNNVLQVWTY